MTLMRAKLEPQLAEVQLEAGTQVSRVHAKQLTVDGRIGVSRLAWAARATILSLLVLVMGHNLYQGWVYGDPLVFYSTLMPFHTIAVFAVGWLSFKCRANGEVKYDLVSVIIPVFNQRTMIRKVIGAVFGSTYPYIEAIAVNDGSRDGTGKMLDELAKRYPSLKVIHKENGGKRTAIAAGFYASRGKYIILMDSDCILDEYAIEEFVKTFSANPRVGGVVGNAKVFNAGENILTKCQDAWYDYAFNIHKTTESAFGTVLCCSGCLAGYRREAIVDFIPYWIRSRIQNSDDRDLTTYVFATPWAKRELAPISRKLMEDMAQYDDSEDRGLTAQTLVEWETVYVPTAIVYTVVPDSLERYIRQQVRWKKGYIRSSFFVSAFFWKKNPLMSLIFYTEFMTTFLSPLVIFAVYFYCPLILHYFWLPITYVAGQLLVGLAAGLDYRFREQNAKNWKYKPLMNLFASLVLPWLVFPALWTYRKNQWLTR